MSGPRARRHWSPLWSGIQSLAPTRANGEVAPKPAVPGTLVVRLKSTRLGHSAFALGMALLPHLEGLFQASAWYDGSTSTAMVKDI